MKAQGRLDIGHVVFESRAGNVVMPGPLAAITLPGVAAHAMQAPDASLFEQAWLSGKHSSFRRGHVFRGVEGEAGQHGDCGIAAERSYFLALISSRQGMSRVFNDGASILGGNVEQ